MKLTAVNNTLRQNKTNNNINNRQNNNPKNVSFKGFADAAVNFIKSFPHIKHKLIKTCDFIFLPVCN